MRSEQIGTCPEMASSNKKAPAGGRPDRGKVGNNDGPYLTRPALDIQAQSPVFPSITPCLLGEYNGGAA